MAMKRIFYICNKASHNQEGSMTSKWNVENEIARINAMEAQAFPKCSVCKRCMTADEIGDEFPEERVCDSCAGIEEEK